jgi:hypothetical protein
MVLGGLAGNREKGASTRFFWSPVLTLAAEPRRRNPHRQGQALIVAGILLYFFGPAALRTDELIVIGLLILALIGFRVWLGRRGE